MVDCWVDFGLGGNVDLGPWTLDSLDLECSGGAAEGTKGPGCEGVEEIITWMCVLRIGKGDSNLDVRAQNRKSTSLASPDWQGVGLGLT